MGAEMFPGIASMQARTALERAQLQALQNQMAGQQTLGQTFIGMGQQPQTMASPTTPAPGQASVPGGSDFGYQAWQNAQVSPLLTGGAPQVPQVPAAGGPPAGGPAMQGPPQVPQTAAATGQPVPSPTQVAMGGGISQGPSVAQQNQPAAASGAAGQPGQPQVRSLDQILSSIVKYNPKATPMQVYQAAAAYLPYMQEQDQALLRQALITSRTDIAAQRNQTWIATANIRANATMANAALRSQTQIGIAEEQLNQKAQQLQFAKTREQRIAAQNDMKMTIENAYRAAQAQINEQYAPDSPEKTAMQTQLDQWYNDANTKLTQAMQSQPAPGGATGTAVPQVPATAQPGNMGVLNLGKRAAQPPIQP